MKNILIISEGSKFNEVFDPIQDAMVQSKEFALQQIASKPYCNFEYYSLLNIEEIKKKITSSHERRIIVCCNSKEKDELKTFEQATDNFIVLVNIDTPYQVDPINGTAILCLIYGQLLNLKEDGMYIANDNSILEKV